jgi:hypothetical protein
MGIVKALTAMIVAAMAANDFKSASAYSAQRSALLSGNNPIPHRVLNQRQKRKRARWA